MVEKGVANVKRRTWDKSYYAQQAQLRSSGQHEIDKVKKTVHPHREEFQQAPSSALGPSGTSKAYLKPRAQKLNLEEQKGTVALANTEDAAKNAGYHCQVCEVTFKDSVNYVDHINSKLHLRKIGFTNRVERATVDQVRNRLKRKVEVPALTQLEQQEYNTLLAEIKVDLNNSVENELDEVKNEDTEEDEMMKMMGFSGFKTNKQANTQEEQVDKNMLALLGF